MEEPVTVHKRLIEFLSEKSTTGQDLCDVIVNELEKLELNQNIRGQGYNNGTNMKGVHSGV